MPEPSEKIKQAEVDFLEGVLRRNYEYAQQLDTYANIMIALSSAIFIFSFSQLETNSSPFWIILGLTTGLATILTLMMVRPPKPLRKRGQEESIIYSREIARHNTWQDYSARLNATLGSREEILNQYSKEIYNLTRYYYLPKKLLFKIAKAVLLTGMTISLLIFIIEYL